jgi:glycosyltransferase involved in cell wall biosynthesis
MNIAVNTRFWLGNQIDGYGYFAREASLALAAAHPGHRFYFLFDRPFPPDHQFPANVQPLVIPPPARHPLLWKFWFDVQVPRMLRRIRADLFISLDGFCSLTSRVPQCLVIHDLGFLHFPEGYKKTHLSYYKRYTPSFVKKAAVVATVSEFSKKDLLRQYGPPPEKIKVVYNGVKPIFRPLDAEQRQAVKDRLTDGREYFLYVGVIQPRKNLVNLLKAFSLFKKRLQTNMKLVLAGRLAWNEGGFEQLLSTYKYRADVLLTGYLPEEELAALTASAYAMVYPSLWEGLGVPVLEAMKCGVPVLTSRNSAMEEVAGSAALYFDPADPASIGEQLMRVYKDEPLRGQMAQAAGSLAAPFTWQRTAALLWEAAEQCLKTAR